MTVRVRRQNGEEESIEIPVSGFEFEDTIVGTTDDTPENEPFNPFRVKLLPHQGVDDYTEFNRRMENLNGRPVVIQVRRYKAAPEASPVNLFVPPAYAYTLSGVRMEMGAVAALRDGCDAKDKAGLLVGDVVTRIVMTARKKESSEKQEEVLFSSENENRQSIHPGGRTAIWHCPRIIFPPKWQCQTAAH